MYTTSVSQHPACSSCPCIGRAPSLLFQLWGKNSSGHYVNLVRQGNFIYYIMRLVGCIASSSVFILQDFSLFSSIFSHTPTMLTTLSLSPSLSLPLSQDMNTSLVRASWNELFTLGMAQCANVMNLSTILAAIINHLQGSIQEGKALRLPH